MAQLSTYGEVQALNALFRGANPVYFALATNAVGTIDDDTAGSALMEPNDSAYARQPITFSEAVTEIDKSTIRNATQIDVGIWTADATAPINYALIVDSDTKGAGNILAWFQLETPIAPVAGQPVKVSMNNLSISLD